MSLFQPTAGATLDIGTNALLRAARRREQEPQQEPPSEEEMQAAQGQPAAFTKKPATFVQQAGNAALNSISAAGNLLDLPGSMVRDVATWAPGGLSPRNPFDQVLDPFGKNATKNRVEGRDLLRSYGLANKKDTWGNFGGGIALEMALDPLTYIGVGAATKGFKALQASGVRNTRSLVKEMAEAAGKKPSALGGAGSSFNLTPSMIMRHAEKKADDISTTIGEGIENSSRATPANGKFYTSTEDLPEVSANKGKWAVVDNGERLEIYTNAKESTEWVLNEELTNKATKQLNLTSVGMTPRKLRRQFESAYQSMYKTSAAEAMDKPLRSVVSFQAPLSKTRLEKFASDNPEEAFNKRMARQPDAVRNNMAAQGGADTAAAATNDSIDAAVPKRNKAAETAESTAKESGNIAAGELDPETQQGRSILKSFGRTDEEIDLLDIPQELSRYGLIDSSGKIVKSELGDNATRVMHQAAMVFGPKAVAAMPVVEAMARTWGKLNSQSADNYFTSLAIKQGGENAGELADYSAREILKSTERVITGFNNNTIGSFIHEVGHDARQMFDSKMQEQMTSAIEGQMKKLGIDGPVIGENGRWTAEAEEAFADAFESYVSTGKTRVSGLRDVFKRLKEWMLEAYASLRNTELSRNINPELRQTFETMLGRKPPASRAGGKAPVPPTPGSATDNAVADATANADASIDTAVTQADSAPQIPEGMLNESPESSAAEIERRMQEPRATDNAADDAYDAEMQRLADEQYAAEEGDLLEDPDTTGQMADDIVDEIASDLPPDPQIPDTTGRRNPLTGKTEPKEPRRPSLATNRTQPQEPPAPPNPIARAARPTIAATESTAAPSAAGALSAAANLTPEMERVQDIFGAGIRGEAVRETYNLPKEKGQILRAIPDEASMLAEGDIDGLRDLVREATEQVTGNPLPEDRVDDVLNWLSRTDERFQNARERIDTKFSAYEEASRAGASADNTPTGFQGADDLAKFSDEDALAEVAEREFKNGKEQLSEEDLTQLYRRMNKLRQMATNETNDELASTYLQMADESRNRIIQYHDDDIRRAAASIAKKSDNAQDAFEENLSLAYEKILGKIDGHDYTKSPTIAKMTINNAIMDGLRKNVRAAKASAERIQYRLDDMNSAIESKIGASAAQTYRSFKESGLSEKNFIAQQVENGATESLVKAEIQSAKDAIKLEKEAVKAVTSLPDNVAENISKLPASIIDDYETLAKELTPYEQEVLATKRFGGKDGGVMSLEETAKVLNQSPERVEKTLRTILDKLEESNLIPEEARFSKRRPAAATASALSHSLAGNTWGKLKEWNKKNGGTMSEALVAALDSGENLFWSNPATRTLVQLFDNRVFGARGYEEQEIARKRFRAYERAMFQFRESLAPIVGYVGRNNLFDSRAIAAKMMKANKNITKQQAAESALNLINSRNTNIIDFFEKGKALNRDLFDVPEESLQEFEMWLSSIKQLFPERLNEELLAGLKGSELSDKFISYFPRTRSNPSGIVRTSERGEAMMSTVQDSQRRRRIAYSDLPGGRAVIDRLSIDREFRAIADEQMLLGKGPEGDVMKRLKQHLKDNYEKDLLDPEKHYGKNGKINRDGSRRLEQIAYAISQLDPEHAAKQMPLFGRNFMHDIARYMERSYAKEAIALSGQDLVVRNITTGDAEHYVISLFQKLGMDRHRAYMNVIDQTGRKADYQQWAKGELDKLKERAIKQEEDGSLGKLKYNDDGTWTIRSKGIDEAENEIEEIAKRTFSDEELEDIFNFGAKYADKAKLSVSKEAFDGATFYLTPWTRPQEIGMIRAAANASLNMFKSAVTMPFPAFHGRNFISGQFQNFFFGAHDPTAMGPSRYLRPIRQAMAMRNGKAIDKITKQLPESTMDDIAAFWDETGINFKSLPQDEQDALATDWLRQQVFKYGITGDKQGYAADRVTDTVSSTTSQYPGAAPSGRLWGLLPKADPTTTLSQKVNPLGVSGAAYPVWRQAPGEKTKSLQLKRVEDNTFAPIKFGEGLSMATEDLNRIAPFLAFLKQGVSPEEAARRVQKIQIDYSSLSEFEKQIKGWIPFYTFSSRALGLTFGDLITNPGGKQAWAIRATNRAQDPERPIPEHIRRGTAIPLGQNEDGTDRYLSGFGLAFEDSLDLGSAAFGDVQGTASSLMSRVRPGVQALVETATGRSMFFDRDLGDLDPQVGRLRDNVLGRDTKGLAEPIAGSPAAEFLVGKSPLARVVATANKSLDDRKSALERLINIASGFKITDVNPEAAERIMIDQASEQMKELGAREMALTYVPEWQKERLSEAELAKLESLQNLVNAVKSKQRERKKLEKLEALKNVEPGA